MNEEAMRKALRECVELLGTGILTERSRFRGVIHDMLPGVSLENERKLLIFAVENLSLGEKLLKAPGGEEARGGFFQSLVKEITDFGLSQEAAETVLRSFAFALGWQAPGFGGSLRPRSSPDSCAHRNIDFFANSCRDCGQALYGIFEDNKYTPYEAMRKKERNGVLISIGESYGGVFAVPEHITAIDDDCFSEHADLRDVILPASLRSIGSYAFENCSSLKKLKVPDSVTVIGAEAFKGLKRVYYSGPASGSPWGAREHIGSPKPTPPKPAAPPAPKPQAPNSRRASALSSAAAILRAATAKKSR